MPEWHVDKIVNVGESNTVFSTADDQQIPMGFRLAPVALRTLLQEMSRGQFKELEMTSDPCNRI
jgi:hypothetical protein